jgi:hypothetical protein
MKMALFFMSEKSRYRDWRVMCTGTRALPENPIRIAKRGFRVQETVIIMNS